MRFKLATLVDITETNARRGDNAKSLRQQQNFLTVLQTIGLRSNPIYKNSPTIDMILPKSVGLGTSWNKKQAVWSFIFEIEAEDGHSVKLLEEDFSGVPFIAELNETQKFNDNIFITKNKEINNITFILIDK